jgi:formylglycine-generating enzyme required for sulfatase activity
LLRAIVIAGLIAAVVAGGGIYYLYRTSPERNFVAQCLDVLKTARTHDGMVWIPPGDFAMGDDRYPEEGPIVPAHVGGFWMDAHEVTNGEFAAFVSATHYVTEAEKPVDARTHPELNGDMLKPGAMVFVPPAQLMGYGDISQWWRYVPGANWRHPGGPHTDIAGRENYPVVAVTHADALAYAKWKKRDLPTEAEWEWAARGGVQAARTDHEQPKNANTWQGVFPAVDNGEDGFKSLAPAGCFKPNKFGLYDIIGNVWEWTNDPFTARHDGSDPDRMPMRDTGARYVIKGGSWLCAPNYCYRYRSGSREPQEADLAASHLGFRTVRRAQ